MRKEALLIFLLVVMQFFMPFEVKAADLYQINVGLVTNQFSAELTSEKPFNIIVKSNSKPKAKIDAKKSYVSVKNGKLNIAGKSFNEEEIELLQSDDNRVAVNRKKYRGRLLVKLNDDKKTLTVCNILPVEEYLYGVLPKEIMPLWPEEAIKAQAVAARSFALSAIEKNKTSSYDVKATEMGQVYGGVDEEHSLTNKYIDMTRGIVITYKGKTIEAFYHSSAGGYTENSENIWGSFVPYLRGVVDVDQEAPKYAWEKIVTPMELEQILKAAGYNLGKLKLIKLTALKQPPVESFDRGISGRVKQMTITGEKGSAVIEGNKLRSLLQLNSTLFDITVGLVKPNSIEVPVLDKFGNVVGKKNIPIKTADVEVPSYLHGFDDLRIFTGDKNEKIIIKGRGWGHGLGMSQWGARKMALDAPKNSKEYYKNILAHYYTGVKVQKIY
ncbi:MAG TPA: SpoIID/LytB domain-containing protein [Candidatus Avacidaminococcus intestinavium]|uniref:SpoIID/LytB domain-containing protein n=1 Tax=Candidatus Avacidaminococcus intestinavium TaxID=2840684 RepID=A0A9D1MR18_9FIRM|nr:SpoIID/LytB domain-containing protein [Candidatus Avacidaminococcus intestinavium]